MTDQVLDERRGAVATITLNAPDRLNAVDADMIEAALATLQRLDADPAVRVIALTGAGRGFCSGANLGGGSGEAGGSVEEVDDRTLYAAGRLSTALAGCATPTVALVNGVAAGVGLSFALACDYVLASESAFFTLAFGKIALMPDGGATALVAANVGRAKALRMALTAERVNAPTAEVWGLISECAPDGEFAVRSQALLDLLAAAAPAAVAATTAAITTAALDLAAALEREEAGQSKLLRAKDFAEGVAAFRAKRTPTFTGD